MQKNHKIILAVLAGVLVLVAIITYFIIARNESKVLDETVAVFSNQSGTEPYTDLNGNEIYLDQYLGKILVVATWASWSPFSQADLQTLTELSKEFDSNEVVFLAINRKETKEQAARYLTTIPAVEGVVMVLDPTDRYYAAVGGYAMPEVVIYNEHGEIINHFRGVAPKGDIQTSVTSALGTN